MTDRNNNLIKPGDMVKIHDLIFDSEPIVAPVTENNTLNGVPLEKFSQLELEIL